VRKRNGPRYRPLRALVAALYCVAASAAIAESIQLKPGASPGQTAHRSNIRNSAFCEIAAILGAPSNTVAQFYSTTAAGVECPPEKLAAIDPKALADDLGASSLYLDPTPQSARRYWVADEIWNYGVGETIDFNGVKAAWTASMSPDVLANMISTPYAAAEMRQEATYLYSKGAKVFLIHAPDGKTWVMQSYATEVDSELTFDRLSELDNALKLPDGFRFEVATLRQDLTVDSRRAGGLAHVLRDELHNVYAGCGFDAACSFNPGGVIRPPRHRPHGRRQ
jgi:hypothetical protein